LRSWVRLNSPLVYPGVFPQVASDFDGVNAGLLPPALLVADAMHRAMMRAAERDCEFIAGFAAERTWLRKSDVMCV